MIYFEFIVYMVYFKGPPWSFACGYLVMPTPFVEKTILSPIEVLSTSIQRHLTNSMMVYFLALYSVVVYACLYGSTTVLNTMFWNHEGWNLQLWFFEVTLLAGSLEILLIFQMIFPNLQKVPLGLWQGFFESVLF